MTESYKYLWTAISVSLNHIILLSILPRNAIFRHKRKPIPGWIWSWAIIHLIDQASELSRNMKFMERNRISFLQKNNSCQNSCSRNQCRHVTSSGRCRLGRGVAAAWACRASWFSSWSRAHGSYSSFNLVTESIDLQSWQNSLAFIRCQDAVIVHFTIDPRIEAKCTRTWSSEDVGQAARFKLFVRTLHPMTESCDDG